MSVLPSERRERKKEVIEKSGNMKKKENRISCNSTSGKCRDKSRVHQWPHRRVAIHRMLGLE